MKAEINNENKAKFFAQYWGQNVHKYPEHVNIHTFEVNGTCGKDDYLELKHVKDIDEFHVLSIHGDDLNDYNSLSDSDKLDCLKEIRMLIDHNIDDQETLSNAIDFLRKEGYLVPWMGMKRSELIETGWAKYKE